MMTARIPQRARRRAGRSLAALTALALTDLALAALALAALALAVPAAHARAPDPPRLRYEAGRAELLLHGAPFLILGGELGNSSAGTAAQADAILPRLAARHFNTVLVPVGWSEIEPEEGHFDFAIPDHWIAVARRAHLHLVLLWFGSWKNAFSSYAPRWVLTDTRRFPRALAADGSPLPILSVFGEATRRSDALAFAALMRHVRDTDSPTQTVLMAQVENEVGYLGLGGRDRSPLANRRFAAAVPQRLLQSLERPGAHLSARLAQDFRPDGHDWRATFGAAADEVFMAWYYGRYIDAVARAGKRAYALPMYLNAQLPAPHERAGEYPSGGPYPLVQPIYRAAAPAIDFYAPDIYWPEFEHWVRRYQALGNPVFVPESRLALAPYHALYVLGEARGFGFSAFGVDDPLAGGAAPESPSLADTYQLLSELGASFLEAQQRGDTRALVLQLSSPRPAQTLALGGYLFRASLARSWPGRQPLTDDGGLLVIQRGGGEFDLVGSGLTVDFLRDPDAGSGTAGIAGIDELAWQAGRWMLAKRLNGDQTNQGRQLLMEAHTIHLYRVRLYTYP